jgi:putative FmdB family regulatory protein
MPRFDFICRSCCFLFEETLPFGSSKLPSCPQCKSKKTEKQLTVPGIVFKGKGFYKTDSRRKDSKDSKETKESKDAKSATEPKKPDATKEKN